MGDQEEAVVIVRGGVDYVELTYFGVVVLELRGE